MKGRSPRVDGLIRCNDCQGVTRHQQISNESVSIVFHDEHDMESAGATERWELFECLGCGNITLRLTYKYEWDDEAHVDYFPERTTSHHKRKRYYNLSEKLDRIYSETIDAYNRSSLELCTAGIRALLEGLCADKQVTEDPNKQGKPVQTLEGRINELTSLIPANIVNKLHGFRILVNHALHALEDPNKPDLELALIVVEDILNVLYGLNLTKMGYKRAILNSNRKA